MVISIGFAMAIRKIGDINHRLPLFYILAISVLINSLLKYLDYLGNQSDIYIFATLMCFLQIKITSFYSVILICIGSTISYCAISFNDLIYNKATSFSITTALQAYQLNTELSYWFANAIFLLVELIIYAYWNETKKISSVNIYKKHKEF